MHSLYKYYFYTSIHNIFFFAFGRVDWFACTVLLLHTEKALPVLKRMVNKNLFSKIQLCRNRWYHEPYLLLLLRCVGIWQPSCWKWRKAWTWMNDGRSNSLKQALRPSGKLNKGKSKVHPPYSSSVTFYSVEEVVFHDGTVVPLLKHCRGEDCVLPEMTKGTLHDCYSFNEYWSGVLLNSQILITLDDSATVPELSSLCQYWREFI